MKIVLVSTYASGGAGKACIRLAEALERKWHTVKILTADTNGKNIIFSTNWQKKYFRITRFLECLFFLRFEVSKKVRWSFSRGKFGIKIDQHPSILAADIIHLHWINQWFLSLKGIAQLQELWKPIVWTLHDLWAFTWGCHYAGGCLNFKKGCGNCWYLRKPDIYDLSSEVIEKKKKIFAKRNWQFITCSKWLQNLAESSLLLSSYQIKTIPNPIDTEIFHPQNIWKIRDELRLPKNKKLLLFVATNIKDERKGFIYIKLMLNSTFKNQEYSNHSIELVILGEIEQKLLEHLKYPVHYLGTISDEHQLAKIYWACDTLIMPSLEDNLPNTVMESLACGTPVLAFATGGIPEMVTHGEQWYIARYKDLDDLTSGLQWILDMPPALRQIIRENCLKKVLNSYTYKNIADQYSEIYKETILSSLLRKN